MVEKPEPELSILVPLALLTEACTIGGNKISAKAFDVVSKDRDPAE